MSLARLRTPASFLTGTVPGAGVSPRTLILIRWIAIAGQTVAVAAVALLFGVELPVGPALGAILASVALNFFAAAERRSRPRLSDFEALLYLAFDVLQLSVLLFLTGGIENPFAVLILAPVTVSATILSRRAAVALATFAILCLTVLAMWHLPLPWPGGPFRLPRLYIVGHWTALTLACAFIAAYAGRVASEARRTYDALAASQVALAREQKLSALGGLAAAAAHELGTPLGTIAVVAKELARDLPPDSPYAEDVQLLLSETARCRDILAELARRPEADGGMPFARAPLATLVQEAAAPYRRPGIAFDVTADGAGPEPEFQRGPEVMHGLANLLQNAFQFARGHVHADLSWDAEQARLTIADDGPGFPANLLSRLGEPYLSSRAGTGGHMGLGIFIAQTLLSRTGARLSFANEREGGAVVTVVWRRE